jgi:hypothetical protein
MKKILSFSLSAVVLLIGVMICVFGNQDAQALGLAGLPILANMSREDLEDLAEEALSDSYEGDEYEGFDDLDDEDLYDGFDDPMVSFLGSARSFLDEKKAGVYLTFRIINNSGYSKTICFNPAYFDTKGVTLVSDGEGKVTGVTLNNTDISEITAAGHPEIHAVVADGLIYGTSQAGITVTGVNGKINDHLRFTKKNATRIPEITISSTKYSTGAIDTTQYAKILTIRQVSPYRKFGDTSIDLNEYFKTTQFQSGKIDVDTAKYGLQADDQTLVFMEIDNDIAITFKFNIGGIGNQASTLYRKAEKANRNIQMGTAGKVPVPVRKNMKAVAKKQMNVLRKLAFRKKK